jgi:hypothetical protein
MKNKKIITEVSRIQDIMGLKSIINESFWDDLMMLGAKVGKNAPRPSLIVKSAADEIVIGGVKVSDELSTLLKKEIKGLNDNTTTLKQSIDDVLNLSKKTDPKVYEKLVDSIYNSEKLYESLGNLVTDADTAIRNLVKEKGFSLQKAYDTVMEDVMVAVKNSNMVPDSLIPKISKEVADSVKAADETLKVASNTAKKSLTPNLQKLSTKMSLWLGDNQRTILIAYKNMFKGFSKIEKEMLEIVDEMVAYKTKFPKSGASAMSDYFRRIRDLAASAVKNKKLAMDTIIDDLISDTPELVSNPKLQEEFRDWAVENIENYMINDSSIQPGLRGRMAESTRAYADLFNFKKWDGTKFRRIFNLILQGTPYTSEEVAKRIISRGIGPNIGRRAVSTFFTATVLLPAIASVLGAIGFWIKSGLDATRVWFGAEDYKFESSKGDMIDAMTNAAQSVFPSDLLDIPLFTTYIDDVIMAAINGSTWKVDDIKDPEVIAMAEKGEEILLGKDKNNPNVNDTQETVAKTNAIKKEIKKRYKDLPSTVLSKLYWDNGKAYYKFTTTGTDWIPLEVKIKNDKVYVIKVVNGKNRQKEINTLQ